MKPLSKSEIIKQYQGNKQPACTITTGTIVIIQGMLCEVIQVEKSPCSEINSKRNNFKFKNINWYLCKKLNRPCPEPYNKIYKNIPNIHYKTLQDGQTAWIFPDELAVPPQEHLAQQPINTTPQQTTQINPQQKKRGLELILSIDNNTLPQNTTTTQNTTNNPQTQTKPNIKPTKNNKGLNRIRQLLSQIKL